MAILQSEKRRGLVEVASPGWRKQVKNEISTVSVMRSPTATTELDRNVNLWAAWRSPNLQDLLKKRQQWTSFLAPVSTTEYKCGYHKELVDKNRC